MYTCHTKSDKAFAKSIHKLRLKNDRSIRYVWCAALPLSLYLLVLCILGRFYLTLPFAVLLFVTSCWNIIKIIKMNRSDAEERNRDTVFSESGIEHTVLESGAQYRYSYDQITAAAFSDEAALLYCDNSLIAISAQGVEDGKYPELRAFLEKLTAERTRQYKRKNLLFALPLAAVLLAVATICSITFFKPNTPPIIEAERSDKGAGYAVREYVLQVEHAQETPIFGYICYYSEDGVAVVYMSSSLPDTPLYYASYVTGGWQVKRLPAPCKTTELESGETIYTYQTDIGTFVEVRNCSRRILIEETPKDTAKANYQPQTGYGHFFRVPDDSEYCLTVSGQTLTADQLCP
ncbi:MAG: hypothetical protein IJJ99_05500 [Oscillospiraceae bacterium]|nr:hypothetical protein [Oscillospiraceae bacterium]